jgi:hypothetical protein
MQTIDQYLNNGDGCAADLATSDVSLNLSASAEIKERSFYPTYPDAAIDQVHST